MRNMTEKVMDKKEDAASKEDNGYPILAVFLAIIFFSFIAYKMFRTWHTPNLAFFTFLFGFYLSSGMLISEYKERNPHHPLFKYSKLSDANLSSIICSVPALLYYVYMKSTTIGIVFLILYLFGIIDSGFRKLKFFGIFLTIISSLLLYYAYENMDILLYIFSTFTLAYIFITVSEYLGKNLEIKNQIRVPGFMLIISLSLGIFSNHFFGIEILNIIGLLASAFFGFFFLELTIISFLKDILAFEKKDQYAVFNLLFAFLGLILFGIFIFNNNIYIYIGASLCLSFGMIGLILFLKKYFPEKISRDISFSLGFGILGISTAIFYFLFIQISIILFVGVVLIIFSVRVFYKTIMEARLELESKK